MSPMQVIPAAAFAPHEEGFAALASAPAPGWVVARLEGSPAYAGGTLRVGGAAAPFVELAGVIFAAAYAAAPAAAVPVAIILPARPARCLVGTVAAGGPSAILAADWPEAIARPAPTAAPDLAPLAARVEAGLARHDLDAALAALAEMLLLARGAAETQAAARAILTFLMRHPLCRSPRLGALAAALTEDRAWP